MRGICRLVGLALLASVTLVILLPALAAADNSPIIETPSYYPKDKRAGYSWSVGSGRNYYNWNSAGKWLNVKVTYFAYAKSNGIYGRLSNNSYVKVAIYRDSDNYLRWSKTNSQVDPSPGNYDDYGYTMSVVSPIGNSQCRWWYRGNYGGDGSTNPDFWGTMGNRNWNY